jgi:heterodisulfide reductase subunit B
MTNGPVRGARVEKEVPASGYYLTPSCVAGVFAPSTEPLIGRAFDLLGVSWALPTPRLESEHTCCSGMLTHGDLFQVESTLLVTARLWSVAAEAGMENLVCACVTSYATHSESLALLEHEPGLAEKVDRLLQEACGRRLVIPKHVVHASDLFHKFRTKLAGSMVHRLVDRRTGRPLKVVDHVGCHYAKIFPEKAIGGADYCDVLSALIREWGGAEIDYPQRRACCGMGFRQCVIQPNRGYTMACIQKKLASMAPYAPDLILTNCPGCHLFLDREQWAVNSLTGSRHAIPVLSYAELAGVLLGWDPYDVVGIQSHATPVEPLLEKIGVPVGPHGTAPERRRTDGAPSKKVVVA